MAPTEQKALIQKERLGEFSLSTLPVPKPGKDEVLVKIHSSGLNPLDWKVQKVERYSLIITNYPSVLGGNIAGEVVELGDGVSQVANGDKVFFQGSYNEVGTSGYQQYARVTVDTLAKIPSNVSYDEAATFPGTVSVAYSGLYSPSPHGAGLESPVRPGAKGKYANTPIVVLAGASSVSQFVIQLARLSGFSPIITTASLKHSDYLKSLGATHVFDRNLPFTKTEISTVTDKPIQLVFDGVSSVDTQEIGYNLLGAEGKLVLVLPSSPYVTENAKKDNKTVIVAIGVKTLPHNIELLKEFWAHATSLLESGELKPNRVEVVPGGLNGVPVGLKALEENKVSGVKLVVHPQETA